MPRSHLKMAPRWQHRGGEKKRRRPISIRQHRAVREPYQHQATWSQLPWQKRLWKAIQWGTESLIPGYSTTKIHLALVQLIEQVEELTNVTRTAIQLLNLQLQATSQMTVQNRLAIDAILLQQGGLCQYLNLSRDHCCLAIPNVSFPLSLQVDKMKEIAAKVNHLSGIGQGWLSDLFRWFGWDTSSWLINMLMPLITLLLPIAVFLCFGCWILQYIKTKLTSLSAFVYTRLPTSPDFIDPDPIVLEPLYVQMSNWSRGDVV
ncbi:endogenous retrovirus group V member 2 Env polyprotein-like isoform X1 [Alligator sinensis]|uniref:Endogenous retrovirus group V member 2 Env polyprotein-like isoform X1 n=1 Tax=Alligator sinensis TaxID=38654 RepID=A0A3Q0H4Q3_ALLSI|nr:endogenous retrovirus group V member 2 Env polyprotein-like isoform X1 [Alligator sinensis]